MTQDKAKITLLTYLLLIVTIFIIFFVTTKLYDSNNQINYSKNTLNQKIKELETKYSELSKIKSDLSKADQKDMEKFLINFSEDELTSYFYDYAKNNEINTSINSINLTEWQKNDFGFKEWNINLNVSFDWEESMIKMLNFIINSDKYNFYIHSFDYNFWQIWPREVSIPIKVLYK